MLTEFLPLVPPIFVLGMQWLGRRLANALIDDARERITEILRSAYGTVTGSETPLREDHDSRLIDEARTLIEISKELALRQSYFDVIGVAMGALAIVIIGTGRFPVVGALVTYMAFSILLVIVIHVFRGRTGRLAVEFPEGAGRSFWERILTRLGLHTYADALDVFRIWFTFLILMVAAIFELQQPSSNPGE